MQGTYTMSGQLYEALHNVESAAKALLLSADTEQFLERKSILGDTIRRVECIRSAELQAAQAYVRAVQAQR